MLKQSDMTENARRVLSVVSDEIATVGEIAWLSNLTVAYCQLILTQLAMAGLIKENTYENTYQNI